MGGTICRRDRQPGQIGRGLLPLPWFLMKNLMDAAAEAEDILGHPPTIQEMFVILDKKNLTKILRDPYTIAGLMSTLLREDIVYVDSIAYRWTVRKQEGYFSYSELFTKYYGGAEMHGTMPDGRIVARKARTVNYTQLVNILKSKDQAVFVENAWIWDGTFHFLDQTEVIGNGGHCNHIMFSSFPRSGNSFLRRLVEQLTGISTGSTLPLITGTFLQTMGMKGEGCIDDSIWITKSHHPLLYFKAQAFNANKSFMVVRNPLDVFPSYAALMNTMSHGNKPDYDIPVEYPEWWAWWVHTVAKQMKDFFRIIRRDYFETKRCPLYIVRYEDLCLQKKETLMGLMQFILAEKDLKGSNAERRIDQVVGMGLKASISYNLKATTGQLNIHERAYTPELRQFVQNELAEMIYYFGYANVGTQNPTGFFEYEKHAPENLTIYNKFKIDSQQALDEICSESYRPTHIETLTGECFDVLSAEMMTNVQNPALTHARKILDAAAAAKQK